MNTTTYDFSVALINYERSFQDCVQVVSENIQGNIGGALGNSGYFLKKELPYYISKGDEGWSGYIHYLDLPVYGDTEEDIMDDLHRAIVEYYEILSQQKYADLGHVPATHKIIFESIIEKV